MTTYVAAPLTSHGCDLFFCFLLLPILKLTHRQKRVFISTDLRGKKQYASKIVLMNVFPVTCHTQITMVADIGGKDLKETVQRMMAYLMGHELTRTYNLTGQKGKKRFREMPLFEVVYGKFKCLKLAVLLQWSHIIRFYHRYCDLTALLSGA